MRFILSLFILLMPAFCAAEGASVAERAVRFGALGLTFDATLTEPSGPPTAGPRWGVLLIGGGLANDLDWRIPAEVALDPASRGDAAILAEALARRGAVVLRWSTLAIEDPKRDLYPREATPRTHDDLLIQTRAAADTLAREGRIEGPRIVLVAHSLGAVRAMGLAVGDPRIAGIALLSGARLVRVGPTRDAEPLLRRRALALLASGDRDGSGGLDQAELAALAPGASFAVTDADGSGAVAAWVLAANIVRHQPPVPPPPDRRVPWAEDLAGGSDAPVLCLVGGLDEVQAAQGVLFAERLGKRATLTCLPGLGHTLAKESSGRIAPIDPAAVKVVADWVAARVAAGG